MGGDEVIPQPPRLVVQVYTRVFTALHPVDRIVCGTAGRFFSSLSDYSFNHDLLSPQNNTLLVEWFHPHTSAYMEEFVHRLKRSMNQHDAMQLAVNLSVAYCRFFMATLRSRLDRFEYVQKLIVYSTNKSNGSLSLDSMDFACYDRHAPKQLQCDAWASALLAIVRASGPSLRCVMFGTPADASPPLAGLLQQQRTRPARDQRYALIEMSTWFPTDLHYKVFVQPLSESQPLYALCRSFAWSVCINWGKLLGALNRRIEADRVEEAEALQQQRAELQQGL